MNLHPVARGACAAVLVAALAAAQSPNLLPAAVLPGSPILGPAAGGQLSAALAAGAGSSLLVFEDDRAGDSDLFGVRLDAAGQPLDAVPFPITKDPGNQTAPQVVWNGQNWLVVYNNQYDPGSGYFATQFAALRVAPSGQVLDSAPIVVGSDSTGGTFGAGSDGVGWVVLYLGYSAGNSAIHARRIDAGGNVLDPGGVVVWPGSYYLVGGLAATWNQGHYLFTWQDSGLQTRRFTAQLQPIDPAPVNRPYPGGKVAANGAGYLVVWSRQTPQFDTEVVGARLDAALNPVGTAGFAISGSGTGSNHTDPRVVWDGSRWWVVWSTQATLQARVARIGASGSVLDPGGIAVPDGNPSYLYGTNLGALPGGGAMVTWHDARLGGANDVYGVPFTAAGGVGAERNFSIGAEALRTPRVAEGPDQYLLTFRAETSGGTRILVQRVDRFGNPLDPQPIEAAAGGGPNTLSAGGAAWNGSLYLVTWADSSQGRVLARRLDAGGAWLDPTPIPVLQGFGADVAALGGDFLVTGLLAPSYPQYVFSYGARVRGSDGAVLDSPALGIGPSFATRARVTTLGGRWLVATESHWTHNQNQTNLNLNFVDANGAVGPTFSAGVLNIQAWGSIDLASSGTSAVLVGPTGSNWTNTDLYARRILPDGTFSGAMANITGGVGLGQFRPAITWTGEHYLVAYETYQNNVWFYDYEPDVYATRLAETGAVLDPVGFPVWQGEDWETRVDVASVGEGKALFAASVYVDGGHAAFRIGTRALRPAGLTSYGIGTPGCAGAHRLDASGTPRAGNAGLVLWADRAPVGGFGLGLLGSVADVAGSDPLGLGALLHVGVQPPALLATLGVVIDGSGRAATPLPLPVLPGLAGSAWHVQDVFAWAGPCVPSPLGLSTSPGLTLVIQAP